MSVTAAVCSVAIRKVIELAPAAPGHTRCASMRSLARYIGYSCEGTVEFLLDERGSIFIEMNPAVPGGAHGDRVPTSTWSPASTHCRRETLEQLGLRQEDIAPHGAALQCRITTGSGQRLPASLGRIGALRTAGGVPGVRLAAAPKAWAQKPARTSTHAGQKLTCPGP